MDFFLLFFFFLVGEGCRADAIECQEWVPAGAGSRGQCWQRLEAGLGNEEFCLLRLQPQPTWKLALPRQSFSFIPPGKKVLWVI